MSDNKVKFIRKNGRVIPVRIKGKKDGRKDKSTQVKGFSRDTKNSITAVSSFAGGSLMFKKHFAKKSIISTMALTTIGSIVGGLVGKGVASTKWAKAKKGESDKSLAERIKKSRTK